MGGGFVGEDSTIRRAKRGFVEVEGTVDLGVRREIRIDVRLAEEIEGEDGIGDEATP